MSDMLLCSFCNVIKPSCILCLMNVNEWKRLIKPSCSPLRVPKVPGLKKTQPVTWELGMGYVFWCNFGGLTIRRLFVRVLRG